MFKYASLTKQGMALIAQATNLKQFVFTRMEYGNGVPSGFSASKTNEEIKAILCEMTSLVSKKADIGMYSVSVKNNCATLTGKIINSSVTEDFLAKELGVFAKIDDGEEVLVAYFVADDKPDPINQAALVGQEHKIVVDVAVGNAENVTIVYSPETYASKGDFDALVAQNAEEHAALEQAIADIVTSETITNIQQSITDEATARADADTALQKSITDEVTARENADTALQKSITDLEASFDEKIGNIDISASLRKTLQFDHVVDSDETLLAWANCTDKSMKSVLVKAGTYSLSGKMINLVSSGTKFIFGEDGNQINITEYDRGIGATADYGAVVIGLNVKVTNSSYSSGEIDGVFYRGMTCINCNGTGDSSGNIEGIFNQCSCIDCKAAATATGTSKNYYSCKGLFDFTFDESSATLTINTD